MLAALLVGATVPASAAPADRFASAVCVRATTPSGELVASGFVVPPGTRVLTTAHGLERVERVRVRAAGGRELTARIERRAEGEDLAVLALDSARLTPARLGSIASLSPGDEVTAVGCPLGLDFSVSRGVVSAIRETEGGTSLIQTDVPVNPGSSGGPLFDREGRVVGIVKAAARGADRIHFALPIEAGRALLAEGDRRDEARRLFAAALAERDPARKTALYREVVAMLPSSVAARSNLALALERSGEPAEAERVYREVLRRRPGAEGAALNLGALLHRDARYEAAVAVYEAAIPHVAEPTRLRNNLAEAYRAGGRTSDARREFETILAANPTYAPAHYGLALVFDEGLRDPTRAAAHYRKYLDLAPDAPDAAAVRRRLDRLAAVAPAPGRNP